MAIVDFIPALAPEAAALHLRRATNEVDDETYLVLYEGIEVGSIGIQTGPRGRRFWTWRIDSVLPLPQSQIQGIGVDKRDCLQLFRTAWLSFCTDSKRLSNFLDVKTRARQRPSDIESHLGRI